MAKYRVLDAGFQPILVGILIIPRHTVIALMKERGEVE